VGRRGQATTARQAELVGAGSAASRFPLVLVPEPEAAAWYSYTALADRGLVEIHPGEKFLVADVGGRSTDVVVHERVNRTGALELREVTARTGTACGSADTDSNFLALVHRKIGCLREFSTQHPTYNAAFLPSMVGAYQVHIRWHVLGNPRPSTRTGARLGSFRWLRLSQWLLRRDQVFRVRNPFIF
jgi:hypothetical protein